MPDEAVKQWKQKGSLYLWRYIENTRNYPGWNLSTDDLFCEGFINLTEKMLAAHWSSQKTLDVTLPDFGILSIPNNRGGSAQWKSAKSLLLKHLKDTVDANHFSLKEIENNVVLHVGSKKLQLLIDCIMGISKGNNDYLIGSEHSQLWFW